MSYLAPQLCPPGIPMRGSPRESKEYQDRVDSIRRARHMIDELIEAAWFGYMAKHTARVGQDAHAVVLADLASRRVEYTVRHLQLDAEQAARLRQAADTMVLTMVEAAGLELPRRRHQPQIMRPAPKR